VQTDVSARRLLGALLVVTLPFAAGCGANRDSGTDNIDARPYSGSADAGELAVRAVRVIPAEDQFVSSSGDSSAEAYLTLAIVNTGTTADTLMNATVEGASVAPGGGPGSFRIEPHHTLSFGTPDLGHEGPWLRPHDRAGLPRRVRRQHQRRGADQDNGQLPRGSRGRVRRVSPSGLGSSRLR
jgi:hypothetical protein